MKSFLIENEQEFLSSMKGYIKLKELPKIDLDSRLLIQWAYDIAKGMKYLSRKHIMHGDLAARNILISRGNMRWILILRD